jgi:poly-beta-1,6-N-acetyl-D-glucosamine synthase
MQIIVYLGCAILIILGFAMFRSWKVKQIKQNSFSIVIACRNEEQNLPKLFSALQKLDYPKDKFEIIIVDDASTDKSPEMLKDFTSTCSNARCYFLEEKSEEYKGKKAALKLATENAKFKFLLFTDADCVQHPNWINGYNKFIDEKIGMVLGIYTEENATTFRKFCTQFSSALYLTTTGLGLPFSAAGSNMCVRKPVFEEVGGYEKIKDHTAGDDKLMLQLVQKTSHKIAYNHNKHVVAQASFFSHDKNKRVYGKAKLSSLLIKIMSFSLFLFYLLLPVYVIVNKNLNYFLLYYFGIVFFWICNLIRHKFKLRIIDFFYLVIYPYFVIIYTFWGMFATWKWKGQKAKN